jgi:hypothetical protein
MQYFFSEEWPGCHSKNHQKSFINLWQFWWQKSNQMTLKFAKMAINCQSWSLVWFRCLWSTQVRGPKHRNRIRFLWSQDFVWSTQESKGSVTFCTHQIFLCITLVARSFQFYDDRAGPRLFARQISLLHK